MKKLSKKSKLHGRANSVVAEIAAERKRQVSKEGWTAEHDDDHGTDELAKAAAAYAFHGTHAGRDRANKPFNNSGAHLFPREWAPLWFKPTDRRRNLIKAAALIVAEIERLDRARRKESRNAS